MTVRAQAMTSSVDLESRPAPGSWRWSAATSRSRRPSCGPGRRPAGPRCVAMVSPSSWRAPGPAERRHEEPGVVAPGRDLGGDPVAHVVDGVGGQDQVLAPADLEHADPPGVEVVAVGGQPRARRPGFGASAERRSCVRHGLARRRATSTPASSKHSRRAATQKARPPDSTPRRALASASVSPRRGPRPRGRGPRVDRPAREDVGAGHELGGQIAPSMHTSMAGPPSATASRTSITVAASRRGRPCIRLPLGPPRDRGGRRGDAARPSSAGSGCPASSPSRPR